VDIERLLSHTELFGGLSEQSAQLLAHIAIPKTLNKGQTLFVEGEKGMALYLLGTGSIQLTKEGPELRQVVVRVIEPGEVFAEVILFQQDRYPVTAMAVRKSTVLILPRHQFNCLLDNPSFRGEFIGLLMSKQRYLTERIRFLVAHEVDERFYLYIKEHYGRRSSLVPGVSKKDLAAAINTIPETFSRLLLKLKKEGLASWEGGELRLSDEFWDRYDRQ
jgi:CRP/FNR family transcriptional regulator